MGWSCPANRRGEGIQEGFKGKTGMWKIERKTENEISKRLGDGEEW